MQEENISIFIASDDNYSPYVAVTMASICANTESFVDFYIIDDGIKVQNKEKISDLKQNYKNFSLEFLKVDCRKEFSSVVYKDNNTYITLTSYDRFLIPKLKPNLKKAIYLDCDIIALGDIKEMYDIDLGSYSLGAVSETFATEEQKEEIRERLGLNYWHEYFNSGVMLIDVQKWLETDVLSTALKIEKEYRDKLKYSDQDILNIIFDNNYKIISNKFNFMSLFFPDYRRDIVLRHFCTFHKPWNYAPVNGFFLINTDDFWKYARNTSFFEDLLERLKPEAREKILSYDYNIDLETKLSLIYDAVRQKAKGGGIKA